MNQRDLELLSSYLDGHLGPSDVTRLEARLKSDPRLASVLNDLRATRSLLRKLPARKAPRNFTLTRKMVGQNPPLPRSYSFFRFATTLATLLFVFSFGLNAVGRFVAHPAFGFGGGGGNASEDTQLFSATAAQAPAATEAPALAPPEAQIMPTPSPVPTEVANSTRSIEETPIAKYGEGGAEANPTGQPDQLQVPVEAQTPAPLIASAWQIGLAAIAILGGLLMFLLRQVSASRWRK